MIYCGINTCLDIRVHKAKLKSDAGTGGEIETLFSFVHLTDLASSSPPLFLRLLYVKSLSSWKLTTRRRLMEVKNFVENVDFVVKCWKIQRPHFESLLCVQVTTMILAVFSQPVSFC